MAAITSMLQVNLPQSFAACRLTWQCLLPSGSSCAPRRWSGCVPCWALKWPTSSGRLPPPPFDTAPPADTQQLLLSGAPCRTAGRCAEPSSPCCPPGWRSTPCRPPPGCRWPWIRPSKPASCSQKQDGVSASVPLSSFSSKRFDVLLAGGFLQEILVCLPERVQDTLLQQLVQILSVSWNRDAIKKRSSEDPIWTGSETHLRGTSWPGSGEGFQRRIETLERRRDHQTRRNTRRENCRDTETPRDWFPPEPEQDRKQEVRKTGSRGGLTRVPAARTDSCSSRASVRGRPASLRARRAALRRSLWAGADLRRTDRRTDGVGRLLPRLVYSAADSFMRAKEENKHCGGTAENLLYKLSWSRPPPLPLPLRRLASVWTFCPLHPELEEQLETKKTFKDKNVIQITKLTLA